MSGKDYVDVDYDEVKRDEPGEEAILFLIDGGEVWVPRSLVGEVDTDAMVFTLVEWKATELGLI